MTSGKRGLSPRLILPINLEILIYIQSNKAVHVKPEQSHFCDKFVVRIFYLVAMGTRSWAVIFCEKCWISLTSLHNRIFELSLRIVFEERILRLQYLVSWYIIADQVCGDPRWQPLIMALASQISARIKPAITWKTTKYPFCLTSGGFPLICSSMWCFFSFSSSFLWSFKGKLSFKM